MVDIPCRFNSAAARSASSICSPGMNRETDRRTNAVFVARSRSHAFVDPESSTFRIIDMHRARGLGLKAQGSDASQYASDQPTVHLHGSARHVRRGIGEEKRAGAAKLV